MHGDYSVTQPATDPDVIAFSDALGRIRAWGEARDWRGYDPYDGLNSPLARVLPGTIPSQALTQLVKLAPVNVRPLLGIRPAWNSKAIGLVASGYARIGAEPQAQTWLDWLVQNPAEGGATAWGYHFPVRTRTSTFPPNAPNTVATSFVVYALLEGAARFAEERWADAALSACNWLIERALADEGTPYFRYVPTETKLVHNVNALACLALARTAASLGTASLLEPARRALQTTLDCQRPDGSWVYAEGSLEWIDNFHTGYILEALAAFPEAAEHLERGLRFWERELFLPDGTPKYFSNRTLPIDAHNYAQAIETRLAVGQVREAARQATLLVERMMDPSGFVYLQRRRFWTVRGPVIRWSTAPAFRALAGLISALGADILAPEAGKGETRRSGIST